MSKLQPEEHVSDSDEMQPETTTFIPEDCASVCEDSRDYSLEDWGEDDSLSDAGSESNDSFDSQDCEEGDASICLRLMNAESRVQNMTKLSRQLEQQMSSALQERQAQNTMRLKYLYRNLAAAVLGRLTAKSAATRDRYNSLCLSYLRKLLQLQNRETVTKTTRTILSHLQRRINQRAPQLLQRGGKTTSGVFKWKGMAY